MKKIFWFLCIYFVAKIIKLFLYPTHTCMANVNILAQHAIIKLDGVINYKELSLTLSGNIPHSVKPICISFSVCFSRNNIIIRTFYRVNKVIEITSHVSPTFQVLFVIQNTCISLIFMILYGDKSCKQIISRTYNTS
jgi:hypothetical protein